MIIHRTLLEFGDRPGPDVLKLGPMPMTSEAIGNLHGSLENLKASAIYSKQYTLALTLDPAEHLKLKNQVVKLFWEGPWEGADLPGRERFMRYRHHSLGKSSSFTFHVND